jgi:hypothetical protein
LPDPDRIDDPPLVHAGEPGPVTVHVMAPAGVGPLAGPVTVTVKVADPPRAGEEGLLTLIDGVL